MSLRIGYGVLTAQRLAGSDRPFEDIYADELAFAVAAEELGFDSVWLSEHHFTEDGYLSAIFPMMAAIAARTSRVDLGTDVILSPMHHPLRFAEDAAAVAVLAGTGADTATGIGHRLPRRGVSSLGCPEIGAGGPFGGTRGGGPQSLDR